MTNTTLNQLMQDLDTLLREAEQIRNGDLNEL